MSTFDNSFIPQGYTPDEIWKLNSIYNQANPQPTVPYIGDNGDYKYTDKATFALMLAGDPERYSTRESAILQASASTTQSHLGGGESNSFGGKNNWRLNNRGVDDQLDNIPGLSDLAKESIRILNGAAFNQTSFNQEVLDLGGTFGQRPGVAMGSTGQDDAAVTLGDLGALTPIGMVADIVTTGSSRFWNNANLQGGRNSIVDGLRAQYDGDKKQMVEALIRMGSVGESTLAQINSGEITLDQVLEDHENSGISDGVKRMSSVMKKLPASVALQVHESGLTGWSAEAYAYELLNASGTKAAGQLYRGENTEEAMALMLALIEVNGPDAYRDTMSTVYDPEFDRSTAWESLDESWKGVLTRAGHTEENFLADAGNVNNYMAYGLRAKELFANAAGREMREHRFSEGLHNGWSNWTRRLTDTFRVDVGKDPYAMYFLQTVPFAVGAGLAFSGGAAAATGTNVGRVMAFSAIDGLIAGAGEGTLMSMAQQGQSFYAGRNESPFDHSTTIGDGLLYGAMGGIAGGLLGGGIAGLPSMFNKTSRGIGDLSRYVSSKADNALVAGGFESAGVQRARNRIAVRDATSDQILGIRPFTNIENEGVRLRLIAGDISAVDAIEESLGQGWVTGKANQVLAQVDSANLERHGVSALEVVDAVFGIQKQLGGKDKISADNLSELLSLYIKRANKNKRLPTVDGKPPSRVKLLDDAVAARSNADNQHWVGGTGTAEMSVKELAEFKNVLIRKARAGVAMTQAETSKFIRGIYSLRDGRSRKAAAKLLDSVIMTTEDGTARRLTSKELGEVRGRLAKSDAVSKRARKSKLFKKIRRMETMLNMVDNERTIGIARKYGITPQTVKKFIEEYYQAVGSESALKALRQKKNYAPVWDFLAEANTDNKLNMQIDEAIEGAYSWEKFLQSDEMSAVREANELRKKIAADQRTIRRDLLNNKTEGSTLGELTAKLKEGLSEAADKLRKIERKLGVGMSRAAAMDAVEARANSNIPMNLLHPDEKSSRLSTAFQRLSDRANGDKAASSTDSRNAGWIRSVLKGTSLGRAIEEKLSAIVVYPQAQQRLFRHRWTTVRGVAQFISGQHISSRGFSNSMDFMSIESIVESAKREAVPYLLWRRTLDRRLGRDGSRQADSEMLRLRQTGAFVKGGDWIDQVSPEVRRLYADNGGDKALREDLLRSNDLLTDLYSRSLAEMQETGMGMGGNALDPRRFIVNRIGGGLNSKNVANFLGSFVPLRQKQLLKDGTVIDFDTLVSIGWIRALDVEDSADGKVIRNFEIPIDSPFAGNSVSTIRKILSNNLNLDELDGTLRVAAREGAGIIEKISRDVNVRDIYQGQTVLGNLKNAPVRETANQNTSTRAAAEAIAGTAEDLNDMIRARNALALIPEAYRTPAQRTLATQLDDAIYKTQAQRNRIAAAQMLGTDSSVVKRANISLEEQAINANDDVLYRGLSDGHDALVTRLDNLLAEGLMTEDAKRLVMMAFGDVDPSKLMGMAMYRLDVTDGLEYKGSAVSKDGRRAYTGLIKLRDVLQYGDNADMDIAETFIHEVAHIAFLSASPKMQRTLQALFEQSKNGDNSIVSLFKEVGVDVAYAFQDVHEFTAALAEVALLSNRIVNTTEATSTFMESMKQFFVKLLKNFMIVPENKSAAMRTMGRDIPELRNAIKNIFAQVEDDAAATTVIKKYKLSKRMRSMKDSDVDEYGHIAFKVDLGPLERELEQAKILRNMIKGSSLTEDETAKLVNMEQKHAAGPFLTEAEKTEMRELQSRQLDIQSALREAEKKLGDAEKKLGDAKNKLAKESKPPKEIIEAEENLIASVEPKRNFAIGTPLPSKQKLMPDDPPPKKGKPNRITVKTKIEMILNDLKEDKNWLGLDIKQKWEIVENQMAHDFTPNSQSKMSAVMTNGPFLRKQKTLFDLENTRSDVERITELSEFLRRKIKNITEHEVQFNSQSQRKLEAEGKLKSSTAFDGSTVDSPAKESTESLPTRESALNSLNDSFEWLKAAAEDAATTADQRLLVIALIRHKAMMRAALTDRQQFLTVDSKTGLLSARKLTESEKKLWDGPRKKDKKGNPVPSNTMSHHADRLVKAQQQALSEAGFDASVVKAVNKSNTTRTTNKEGKPRAMLTVQEANDMEKALDGARVRYNKKVAAETEAMRVTVRDDAVSNHPASVNANDAVANGSKGPLLHSAKTGEELTSDADSMSRQDFIDSTNPKTDSESDAARDFHAALHPDDYPSTVFNGTGDNAGLNFTGYTRYTTEELYRIIDDFEDGLIAWNARIADDSDPLMQAEPGAGVAFTSELQKLFFNRKAETRAAAALEAETAADIPARVSESDEAPVARMDDADDETPEVRDAATELNEETDILEDALEAARVRVEADNWPPPGSIAERDRVWFPYAPTKIDDDEVDRAYVFYNQEGEPVFISHTVDEETLPDGSRQRVMFVDFEAADASGEVSPYVNTNSGDARAVIRTAFSKAEEDAREMGVNIIRFSRGDSEGYNVGGARVYKRLVEEAYPNRVVYSSKPYGGNPQLAVTLDNTNPMLSLTDVIQTDRSYYLLTDGRVRTIIREQTDWPIDLNLRGVELRNAIDSYLSDNLSRLKLEDNIPVWNNRPRAIQVEATTAPKTEAPAPKAEAPTAEAVAKEAMARRFGGRKPEAPAPKTEAPTAETPRVDAGDGAPPIPPKPTARGAAGDGEGADDLIAIKNQIRERLEQYRAEQGADTEYAKALRESLSRKVPDEGDKVVINASHRLASNGNLRSIYNDALNGNTSILHKDWVDSNGTISGLTHDGRRYLDNQGGNYSSGSANDLVGREIRVREMSRPNPFENRRFHDIDFDTEEGNALARLFADSTDSSTMVRDFAVGALSSIRIQQAVNQLTGMTGGKYSMSELLTDFANILDKEVKGEARLGGKGYRTVDTEQTKEVKELLMSMQDLYMRARGYNPGTPEGRGRPLNRGTRIARNLTQSMLGGKFALSVMFVEAPLGVLRASGLNPFKLAQNTGIIMASLAESAVVGTTAYKPVQKFLSGFGITKKISAETLDDMTHAMDSMTSSSLNRMTSGGQDEIANEALLFSFRDRIKAHIKNIKGDPDRRGESTMATGILDKIEGVTAAGADMTGMLSFMQPVTKAVRDVAENQGKAVFLKHVPGLRKVAEELAELGDDVINTEAIVRIARKHGVPQQVAVLASRTKLLSNGGAYLDRLGTLMTDLKFGKEASAGRDFSLNILQSKIYDSADEARATGLGLMFNEAAAKTEVMDRELLVSVNDFLQQFIGDFSPELRGTMRFGGENPVVDMLYQLLGYPIAAYQALVQNGIQTRGVTMSAGILVALAGLEYSNRNLQRVINAKNEEQRQAALAKLTRMYTLQPTKDDMVEVIAAYGTTSPLFGAIGQHLRGLVGNPIMRATGHDERLFPHSPFTGPAVGMVQKVYGNISKTLGGVGTYARSGDLKPLQAGAGGLTEDLVKILTPFNSFAMGGDRLPQAFSSLLVGAGVAETSASSTMAGPSHPLVRANGYNSKDPYAWTRADFSPDGISGFTPNLKPVIAPEDLEPIPEPAPQRAKPRTEVPAQAVSGVDAVLRKGGPLKAPDSLLN